MNDDSNPLQRALRSLDGLSIGDALGEMLSLCSRNARIQLQRHGLPPAPWTWTDDTEMAMGIIETLAVYRHINQDALAERFVRRFRDDPGRGYGSGARRQLDAMMLGESWRATSPAAFGGKGSMGNGGAMRVAPLGAYFAGDFDRVVEEAKRSAEVTHAHPEGISGAIAVAIGAAVIWENRANSAEDTRARFWEMLLALTPRGETWDGLQKAAAIPLEMSAEMAARILGSGFLVTAPDTVPYALWCAARHLDDYAEALLTTLEGDGDCDTNCAIVGGLVALYGSGKSVPDAWLKAREPLNLKI